MCLITRFYGNVHKSKVSINHTVPGRMILLSCDVLQDTNLCGQQDWHMLMVPWFPVPRGGGIGAPGVKL